MKEIIRGETVNLDTFTRKLRSFANHCVERCEALKVPLYPDAVDILAASDDDIRVVQLRNGYTHQQLDTVLESLEDKLYRYLLTAYVGRVAMVGRSGTDRPLA